MTNYYDKLGLKYSQVTQYKRSILERDDYTCQLCGNKAEVVDHIIPWAISRDSSKDNLRALCRKCNIETRRPQYNANPFDTLDKWYRYLAVSYTHLTLPTSDLV